MKMLRIIQKKKKIDIRWTCPPLNGRLRGSRTKTSWSSKA